MNGTGHAEHRIEHLHDAEDVLGAALEEAVAKAIDGEPNEIPLPARLSVKVEVEVLEDIDV